MAASGIILPMDNAAAYRRDQDHLFQEIDDKEMILQHIAEQEERFIDTCAEWYVKFRENTRKPAITKEEARARIIRVWYDGKSPTQI